VDFLKSEDIEFDVSSIPLSQLERMLAAAKRNEIDQGVILWCHRIATGIPIYDKQNILAQLKSKLDLRALCRTLVALYTGQATMFLNDSLGAFESRDYDSALITGRLGVEAAALAYLSSSGIINPKTKWIYRYLLKVKESEKDKTADEFKVLERVCVNNDAEVGIYINQAMEFINRIITQAQISP
jgi:HEPN domain-containing protein